MGLMRLWVRGGFVLASLLGVSMQIASAVPSAAQAAPSPPPPIAAGQFAAARGTDFVIGDVPFRFVGANINPIHGDSDRRATQALFEAMGKDGLNVARVWALGEGMPDAGEWEQKYALFRAGPDRFLEDAFLQLDRILMEARRAHVRVILTLSNNWADYGGVPMYLRWLGLPPDGMAKEAFYSDERAHALFRAHVGRLLARTNSLTGIRYSEDPTIFAWELMNESTVETPAGRKARLAWVREMAQFIKTFDPHHMVAAGLWGYAMRSERADFVAVHKLANIDYVDSHLYLQNSQGNVSLPRLYDFLDDRAQLARHVIKKPLLIGEFGFRTDKGPTYLGLSRARWFSELLLRHFRNRGGGALVWIYEPYSGKPRDFGIYIDKSTTDDVRQALRTVAAQIRSPLADNPRLAPSLGDAPLYAVDQVLHGLLRPRLLWQKAHGGELSLRLAPSEFRVAHFERLGVWDGQPAAHFYGAESGDLVFGFSAPPAMGQKALAEVEVRARLSSEWPGAQAPADGGSLVQVELDGMLIGQSTVIPDDGHGAWYSFRTSDPRILGKLSTGEHTLRLHVPPGPLAHGLCLYGDARDPKLVKTDYGPLQILLHSAIPATGNSQAHTVK